MIDQKKFFISLMLMLAVIALSGCASSSGDNATTKPMYIVTVGTGPTDQPVLAPTDMPVPTPTATPVPTPTPVPEPVTLSNLKIVFSVEGGQEPGSIQYAVRHDTATFTIADTGQVPLNDLSLIYEVDTHLLLTDGSAIDDVQTTKPYSVGTLFAGDEKKITMEAPIYSALADVNMTITAKWRDGSLVVYKTFLKSNTSANGQLAPENNLITRSFGFI
jgi:hypothetical protein